MTTEKEKILLEYVDYVEKNGVRQHTDEWLQAKKYVIGGSQMASVIGMNGYETKQSAILKKLGHAPFGCDKYKMSWGNVFEDIIKNYVERYYSTKVYADNAFIPVTCGLFKDRIAYSPDGLCIISNELLIKKYGSMNEKINELDANGQSIVLLEFKAPYSRRTDPENIPEYYIPQPLTGMDVIGPVVDGAINKICDLALFIECEFRLCEYSHIPDGREHCFYPTNHPESTPTGKAHAFGLFIVYGPEEGELYNLITESFGSVDIANNLGTMDKKIIDKIIVGIDENWLVSLHTGPCKNKSSMKRRRKEILADPSKSRNELNNNIDGLVEYGTVYWKLLTYRAKPMFPEEDYLMKHKDDIIEFTDLVNECASLSKLETMNLLIEKFDDSEY